MRNIFWLLFSRTSMMYGDLTAFPFPTPELWSYRFFISRAANADVVST